MAANVTKRLWKIGDIVDVLEAWEASNTKNIVSKMRGQRTTSCLA
jgi:hypothetical protein